MSEQRTYDLANMVLAHLNTSALIVIDGEPKTTPRKPYVCFYDTTGVTFQDRTSGARRGMTYNFRLICAAIDPAGLRDTVDRVRASIDRLRITGWTVRELEAGPQIVDGPPDDRRYSKTLVYTSTT